MIRFIQCPKDYSLISIPHKYLFQNGYNTLCICCVLCYEAVLHYNDTANVALVNSKHPNCLSNDGPQINLCSGAADPQQQHNALPKLSTAGRWRPSCRPAHSAVPASQRDRLPACICLPGSSPLQCSGRGHL